jgi:hypothetical protein
MCLEDARTAKTHFIFEWKPGLAVQASFIQHPVNQQIIAIIGFQFFYPHDSASLLEHMGNICRKAGH